MICAHLTKAELQKVCAIEVQVVSCRRENTVGSDRGGRAGRLRGDRGGRARRTEPRW